MYGHYSVFQKWGRRGPDHVLFGFMTTYAINAYHH